MGLANWLTVLRIVLIPVFVTLMVYRQPGWALAAFALAAITDLLDGWVARRQRMASRLGAFLDPLADKLLLTASFVTLTYLKTLPFWITAVVLSRDIILIVGALVVHMVGVRIDPEPTRMGKLATFFQVLTVLTGLLSRYFHVMLAPTLFIWLAAVFTVASGCQYLVRGMRVLNAATAVERDERNEHESSLLR
jgi:cardiolipin synthase (CMP-forming)